MPCMLLKQHELPNPRMHCTDGGTKLDAAILGRRTSCLRWVKVTGPHFPWCTIRGDGPIFVSSRGAV